MIESKLKLSNLIYSNNDVSNKENICIINNKFDKRSTDSHPNLNKSFLTSDTNVAEDRRMEEYIKLYAKSTNEHRNQKQVDI